MAGMGMSEAAMKAARLQTVVVTTETPDLRITSPTWSCNIHNTMMTNNMKTNTNNEQKSVPTNFQ
jgi:hypothetical protein